MQNFKAKIGAKRHGKAHLQKIAITGAQAIASNKEHHHRHNRRHYKLGYILVIAVFDQALFYSTTIIEYKPVLHEKGHHKDSDNDQQQSNQFFLLHVFKYTLIN